MNITYVISSHIKNVSILQGKLMDLYLIGVDPDDILFVVSTSETDDITQIPKDILKHTLITPIHSFEYTGLLAYTEYVNSSTVHYTTRKLHDNIFFLHDTVDISKNTINYLNTLDPSKDYVLSEHYMDFGVAFLRKETVFNLYSSLLEYRNTSTVYEDLYLTKHKIRSNGTSPFKTIKSYLCTEPPMYVNTPPEMYYGKLRVPLEYVGVDLIKHFSNFNPSNGFIV
jgi:hypothetical protein